ncbi:MAG: C39 family peptidase [Myxococcaceae bacterium]
MRLPLLCLCAFATLAGCDKPLLDAEVVRPGGPMGTTPATASDGGSSEGSDAGADDGGVIVVPVTPSDGGTTPPRDRVDNGIYWSRIAEEQGFKDFARAGVDLNARGELVLSATGTTDDKDPYGENGYEGGTFYNGASYRYGAVTATVVEYPDGVNSIIPSFDAVTPPGTWVGVKLAARINGTWTDAYHLGVWSSDPNPIESHSVVKQMNATGDVRADTLTLSQRADAIRLSILLYSENTNVPTVRAVGFTAKMKGRAYTKVPPPRQSAWGKTLPVPKRSQASLENARSLYSPAVVSMLLAYWEQKLPMDGLAQTISATAPRVFDWVLKGYDNWIFNTAYAANRSEGKLHGFVTRLASLSQVEALVEAGIPVAINIAYEEDDLEGSPYPSVAATFVVVVGFDATGNVIVNDPGFPSDAQVQTTYKRAQLDAAWAGANERTTYVLYPKNWRLPKDPLGAY